MKTTLLISAQGALAAEPLTLIVQRSTSDGVEEIGLSFKADSVTLTTNSNFFDATGPDARIGLFESELTDVLRTRGLELKGIAMRLAASQYKNVSPHSVRYFVNGNEVSELSAHFAQVVDILQSSLHLTNWRAVDGVQATINKQKDIELRPIGSHSSIEPRKVSAEALECTQRSRDSFLCPLEPYGQVYLKLPAKP